MAEPDAMMRGKLGDFFSISREKGIEGLPMLSVTMYDGLVRRDSIDRKTDSELGDGEHLRVRPGDIAYNMMRMWQGASGLANEDGIVSPAYVVVRPKKTIDPLFASYWFKSERMIYLFWAYSYGLTNDRLRLYPKDFTEIPVELLPVREQRRIAEVLAELDRAIDSTDLLVEAKQRRKRALMQRVFDDARRRVELMDFADLIKTKTKETAGQPSIELECIEGGTGRVLDPVVVGQDAGPRLAFKTGDTLFGKLRPYLRKFAYAYSDGLCSTEIWALRPKSGVCHPRYLFHVVQLPAFDQAATKPTGSKMPRAEWELVSAAPLPLPSMDRQVAIAQLLDAAETEANLLADQANMLREQRRGLMQRLLSGDCKDRSRIMKEITV